MFSQYEKLVRKLTTTKYTGKTYTVAGNEVTFEDLDRFRLVELPRIYKEQGYITLNQLISLHDWKMARGKFRPALPKMIRGNNEELVINSTREAMGIVTKANDDIYKQLEGVKPLIAMRGVGPATAILILSLISDLPFYGDEAFKLLNPEYGKMKYTMKEYMDWLPKMILLSKRMKIELNTLECMLWYLDMVEQTGDEFSGTEVEKSQLEQLKEALSQVLVSKTEIEQPNVKGRNSVKSGRITKPRKKTSTVKGICQ
ncbi:hypothetical protein DAMA08_011660 [Martiniozyma asiatica (nom. inval.)]|nr:hypothetical protein DAMA08_011660 [Martiniozyma asiatica]